MPAQPQSQRLVVTTPCMTKWWNVATVIVVVFSLAIMTTSAALAAPGGNGNGNGNGGTNGNGGNPPAVSATPELDSLVLFGTGAAGFAGYALMRVRARRDRQDD